MSWYPNHIPDWIAKLWPALLWHENRKQRKVYLTFDDGPTSRATPYVLELLKDHGIKATFFLIGKCVVENPELYHRILKEQHSIGNHTHTHPNSWKTGASKYLDDVDMAGNFIDSKLFRPPYGKITPTIAKQLIEKDFKIVMWDVLSGDFDPSKSEDDCLKALKKNTRNGSIVVFHDSEKAFPLLKKVLPEYLYWLKEKGWTTGTIKH